jgi:hypothetical protein
MIEVILFRHRETLSAWIAENGEDIPTSLAESVMSSPNEAVVERHTDAYAGSSIHSINATQKTWEKHARLLGVEVEF